ncbi:MAG: antitoxin VapB family protein [Candidatus ainarchaeum sp.]|nr:antitoxin VapB family protein [Candidatus ainarchaeum sp.]
MVKVITIMDDVYAELYQIKKGKDMSFSQVLRYLMAERKGGGNSIINFASSINDDDIDSRAVYQIRNERVWVR